MSSARPTFRYTTTSGPGLDLLAKREGRLGARGIQLSELTSRVENHKIPEALKSLEKSLMSGLTPEDVVLATNMISVGLDVDRLG